MPSPQWLVAGSCTAGVTGLPKNIGMASEQCGCFLLALALLDHGIDRTERRAPRRGVNRRPARQLLQEYAHGSGDVQGRPRQRLLHRQGRAGVQKGAPMRCARRLSRCAPACLRTVPAALAPAAPHCAAWRWHIGSHCGHCQGSYPTAPCSWTIRVRCHAATRAPSTSCPVARLSSLHSTWTRRALGCGIAHESGGPGAMA